MSNTETVDDVLREMRDIDASYVHRTIFADRIERALSAQSPRYDALLLIAQSVAGALERAGVTDCDDPGEAIDVLRERWERTLAAERAKAGGSAPEVTDALMWLRSALDCPTFAWDADQRAAAEAALTAALQEKDHD